MRPFELVLFVGQLVDSSHDVQVVHPTILARIGCYDGQAERAIAWALLTLMASVGVLIAVVVYLAMGDRAANVLGDLKTWMARNNTTVMAILMLIIAAKPVGDAVSRLSG